MTVINPGGGTAASTTAAPPTGNPAVDTPVVLGAAQSGLPLAAGTYAISAQGINLAAGVQLRLTGQGSGRTTLSCAPSAQNTSAVFCTGSAVGSAYNLAAQANLGDKQVTLAPADAVSLAANPGDYLQLWSSKLIPATDTNGAVQGEIIRVQSVNTVSGAITTYGEIDDTYALADTARLRKLSLVDGSYITGITFVNSAPLTAQSTMIEVAWTHNFRMRDVIVIASDGPGLQVTDSVETDVEIKVRDLADDTGNNRYGYGVLAWGSTRDGRFTIYAERARHAFTTGADHLSGYLTNPQHCGVPRHLDILGEARETTDVGWDSHSQGDDLRYWVSSVACQGPFQARAPHVRLMSWSFQNCRDSGYLFWTATGFRAMPGVSRGTITGNAAIFRVGDTSGNILQDVKFFGMHSDSDGRMAVLQNCNDVTFFDPVITTPQSGVAFLNSGGVTNCTIVLPVTDGVTTMISGGTTGITVINTPGTSPINVAAAPYNAKGDYKTVTDAGIATGTATLTSTAQAAFTAQDVGKKVNVQGAGAAGVPLSTTIQTYTNATTVQLAATASTTVTAGTGTASYGTDNRAVIASALAAGATTIYVPYGNYYVDTSGGSLALVDGHTILGDDWGSIITFGPEGNSATVNCFASNAGTIRFERIRLVAPTTQTGTMFAIAQSASATTLLMLDVNMRLFSFAINSSVGTIIDLTRVEIEGRTSGGTNCQGIQLTGTSGELRMDDCFIWNFGLNNNPAVGLSTGTALDVHRCKFDLQTGTGAVINHTDASGPPTAAAYSRVRACTFGAGLLGPAILTPFQIHMKVVDCDFLSNARGVAVQGPCLIEGNRWLAPGPSFAVNMIDTRSIVVGAFTSVPSVRIASNRFDCSTTCTTAAQCIDMGAASSTNAEGDIVDNDFLLGVSGGPPGPAGCHVRIGANLLTTSRVRVRGNRFYGNTNNNGCVRASSGLIVVEDNGFYGTYVGGVVLSQGGTPTRMSVRRNEFNQATSVVPFVLTTVPTTMECKDNYGTAGGTPAGYHGGIAGPWTQVATDDYLGFNTSAARVLTLLAGTSQTVGKVIQVADETGTVNGITINTNGTDTFVGGGTSKSLTTSGQKGFLYWTGANFLYWTVP